MKKHTSFLEVFFLFFFFLIAKGGLRRLIKLGHLVLAGACGAVNAPSAHQMARTVLRRVGSGACLGKRQDPGTRGTAHLHNIPHGKSEC